VRAEPIKLNKQEIALFPSWMGALFLFLFFAVKFAIYSRVEKQQSQQADLRESKAKLV
jgi:hypothetical protein